MARPIQQVQVYSVQNRRGADRRKLPYVVRYSVDGRHRSRSFRTKAEAERYRSELLKATHAGDRFDLDTGEPASWSLPLADLGVHHWARRWLAEQWPEWQPRTRSSSVEALARFTWLAVKPKADVPDDLRRYLADTLAPDAVHVPEMERRLDRNCLTLADLDRDAVAELARRLSLKLDDQPLAATTANRYRTNAHACVLAAVEAGAIPTDPWPKRSRSRARRKAARPKAAVDVRSLPDPATMATAIAAMENLQPGSRVYLDALLAGTGRWAGTPAGDAASAYGRAAAAFDEARRAEADPAATPRQRRAASKQLPALTATMDAAAEQWAVIGEPEADSLGADIRQTERQLRRLSTQAVRQQLDNLPARGAARAVDTARGLGL